MKLENTHTQGRSQPSHPDSGFTSGPSGWNTMKGNILSLIFGLLWDNGPLCVILAQVATAFMALAVKLVSKNISIYAVICIRSFFLIIIVTSMGLWQKVPRLCGPRSHLGLLICRGIAGAAGMILFTISILYIPIGDANTLAQANVILVIFCSWFFRLETVNWIMAAGVMSCLAGEFLVSQPPFLFGHDIQWNLERIFGMIFSLTGAFFMGAGFMFVGFIGKSAHPFSIILWQHTLGFLAIIPFLVWDIVKQGSLKFSCKDMLLLALIVLLALTRQVFLTRGLQVSNAVVGTSVATIGIALTYAIGLIFLHESISILAGLGCVSVMAGIMIVALGKARLKKEVAYNSLPPGEIELESCESLEFKNGNTSSNL